MKRPRRSAGYKVRSLGGPNALNNHGRTTQESNTKHFEKPSCYSSRDGSWRWPWHARQKTSWIRLDAPATSLSSWNELNPKMFCEYWSQCSQTILANHVPPQRLTAAQLLHKKVLRRQVSNGRIGYKPTLLLNPWVLGQAWAAVPVRHTSCEELVCHRCACRHCQVQDIRSSYLENPWNMRQPLGPHNWRQGGVMLTPPCIHDTWAGAIASPLHRREADTPLFVHKVLKVEYPWLSSLILRPSDLRETMAGHLSFEHHPNAFRKGDAIPLPNSFLDRCCAWPLSAHVPKKLADSCRKVFK